MLVADSERIACFDVDQTLIFWDYDKEYDPEQSIEITCPHDGEVTYHSAHKKHIHFLKKLKARGLFIIVWSSNGTAWAETVARSLGLEKYVDFVMSKPEKIIDDLPNSSDIIPRPIYLKGGKDE